MSQGSKIDNQGGDESLGGPSISTHGPPHSTNLITFRRAEPTASGGPAAGVAPPPTPATFQALGPIVRAVVLRLKDSRLKLNVLTQIAGGDDDLGQT